MSRRSQRFSDADFFVRLLDQPCTKQSNHRSVSPPSNLSQSLMLADFADFGYTDSESQFLLTLREPAVDAFAQIAHGRFAREKRESEKALWEFRAKRERRGRKDDETYWVHGGAKRQQVYLDEGKKWVLFDLNRGWPPTMESNPVSIFEKYARYEPGNTKVVAYNIESYAVTLKSVPEIFRGSKIVYQKAGPKLVKAKRGDGNGKSEGG